MADLFARILHTSMLGGVEFPISSRKVSGGRAFARRRYPFRDGQETEDTGREPYAFELSVPLFAGVDPGHWPGKADALRLMVDDPETKGEVEYVDAIIGPLPVKVAKWSETMDPQRRNGVVFQLTLEEETFEPVLFADHVTDPEASAADAAAEIDEGLAELGIAEADILDDWAASGVPMTDDLFYERGSLFTSGVDSFFNTIESGALATDDIAAVLDTHRTRLDRLVAFDPLQEVSGWSVVSAAGRMADSLAAAAERIYSSAPPVVEWTVPDMMSAVEISMHLYGTGERSDEVMDRNPRQYPLFYRPGDILKVLAS